jgi:hypothetical protein
MIDKLKIEQAISRSIIWMITHYVSNTVLFELEAVSSRDLRAYIVDEAGLFGKGMGVDFSGPNQKVVIW